MRYELATLTIRLGTLGAVVAGIDAFVKDSAARGTFLGCWSTEIGDLNKVIILRGFEEHADLATERMRVLSSTNPFNAGEAILDMAFESYLPFPFLPKVQPGAFGKVYELRTYRLKHGGIPHTIEAWKAAMPERSRISPLTIAMYPLDGSPRFTHIWPFSSLDARAEARAESVAKGVWPPKGGPAWLTGEMVSTIMLPTAISPLA